MVGFPEPKALNPLPFISHVDRAIQGSRCTFSRGWLFRDEATGEYVLVTSTLSTEQGLRFTRDQVVEAEVLSEEAPGFGVGVPFVEVVLRPAGGVPGGALAVEWDPTEQLRLPHGTCGRTWNGSAPPQGFAMP